MCLRPSTNNETRKLKEENISWKSQIEIKLRTELLKLSDEM